MGHRKWPILFICLSSGMKMKILLLLLLGSFSVCAQKKTPISFVQFGSGGGITGLSVTYSINKNGAIYKEEKLPNRPARQKLFVKTKPKKVKAFFKELNAMDLFSVKLEQTGNMTYTIKLSSKKEALTHTITWGDGPDLIPANVQKAHELMGEFVATALKSTRK